MDCHKGILSERTRNIFKIIKRYIWKRKDKQKIIFEKIVHCHIQLGYSLNYII